MRILPYMKRPTIEREMVTVCLKLIDSSNTRTLRTRIETSLKIPLIQSVSEEVIPTALNSQNTSTNASRPEIGMSITAKFVVGVP